MEEIRLLEIEIAKHRKLLNRAVGNKIIAHINYHHYEVIRLIGELEQAKSKEHNYIFGIMESHLPTNFGDMLREGFLKAEDHYILTGEMPNEKSPET